MWRIVIALLFPIYVYSQTPPLTKFGVISKEELSMTTYDKDSATSAVILFDIGESQHGVYKHHRRIKILKEDGYSLANVAIPVFRNSVFAANPTLRKLNASTFNLVAGKIEETKIESKEKYTEEFIDGINVIRFALPKVKVGSIIEYEYEINSGFRDWEFQHLIPCKWSEYRLSVPDAVKFHVHFTGYLAPIVNEEGFEGCLGGQCQVRRWVMVNVPSFKQEPYISYYKNYTSQVKFDMASYQPARGPAVLFLTDWDVLRNRYDSKVFFGDNVQGTAFLKKISKEITENQATPDAKLRVIYEYVKNSMEWTGSNNALPSDDLKRMFEEKKGTSADINLILLAMLRYANLPADPVLCSTSKNGFVRQEVPNSGQFNNVLVWSDFNGKKILLDATDKYLAMEYLPQTCLNGSGYVASENNYRWVSLTEAPKTRNVVTLDLKVNIKGDLDGKISFSKTGYAARNSREKISKTGLKEYFDELFNNKTIEIRDTVFEGLNKINEVLKEHYEVAFPDYNQTAGDVIYIDPILFEKQQSNPFVSETRNYPIDFEFPRESLYSLKLKIPSGYQVDELPQPKLTMLPENAAKFIYSVSQSNDIITLTSQMSINRVFFSQDEYPLLREFFNIIAAKHNQQIVLKKK